MATVILRRNVLQRSYQLLADLGTAGTDAGEAFEQAGDIIWDWAREKFRFVSPAFRDLPDRKVRTDRRENGYELGLLLDPGEGSFIFRCAHPDDKIPGRMWIADAVLERREERCLFAFRLSVTSPPSCRDEVPFSLPTVVLRIQDRIGLTDIVPILRTPHLLTTTEQVDAFVDLLEDPARRLPVMLLTPEQDSGGADPVYAFDPYKISKEFSMAAHFFCITAEMDEYYTWSVGRPWSALDGSVRTYWPGVSFDGPNWYQHPLLTRNGMIRRWGDDRERCMRELGADIQRHLVEQQFPWEENGIRFYLSAYQDHLRAEREAHLQQSREELAASYEEQIGELKKSLDEAEMETASYQKMYEDDIRRYEEEKAQRDEKISSLEERVKGLEERLSAAGAAGPIRRDAPVEEMSYAQIRDQADTEFSGRLVLLRRARRSLKKAEYEDRGLVYRCLELLATDYRDCRMGKIDKDEFDRRLKKVDPALDLRPSISDSSAGTQGDTYFVQYKGQNRKLKWHLTKGHGKDDRTCLRIYFFWDAENELVVIGDLPRHLDTRAT